MPNYFFTGDQHFGHANAIRHSNRPFADVDAMNEQLIYLHNSVVGKNDIVIHVGDFTLGNQDFAQSIIRRLNGKHTFLRGNHDRWLPKGALTIWEKMIDGQYVVACHYAMRVWPRSHYGAWQVYGHSHGALPPIGKQWDVGVDNNDYKPVSFEALRGIMGFQK